MRYSTSSNMKRGHSLGVVTLNFLVSLGLVLGFLLLVATYVPSFERFLEKLLTQ